MRIEGRHTFDAPRELVWSLLHEPLAIQQAMPGCDHFHQRGDGKFHIKLNLENGPFSGRYNGIVSYAAAEQGEAFTLSLTGSGGDTLVSGEGKLSFISNLGQTDLFFEGDVEAVGPIAKQSPRLVRTTANYLIRTFLEGIDLQINQATGNSGSNGLPLTEPSNFNRTTATIGIEDFLADIRRDRWVAVGLLVVALLSVFSFLGVVLVVIFAGRWALGNLTKRKGSSQREHSSTGLPTRGD